MAVSTRQKRRPDAQSGLFKKIAASVLIAGPFLAAGGYGVTESDLPGWASGELSRSETISHGTRVSGIAIEEEDGGPASAWPSSPPVGLGSTVA